MLKHRQPPHRPRKFRIRALASAATLALAGALTAPSAYADVRDTDIICGASYAEQARAAEDQPDIFAAAAIVVGQDGTAYFERDADAEVKIASLTKVMTAIIALENAQPDDTITVDQRAATVGQSTADLKEGDKLPLSEALKGLMMPSGNDAAMAIATSVGALIDPQSDDPYQTFIDAMNTKAAELGMDHTVFANPHGLDFDGWEGDFHSTARDVATMFAHAMKNEAFRSIVADTDNRITVTSADGSERTIELKQRNEILGQDGNIGGKTGGTYIALSNFVGAFNRETGGEIYTVVLGSETSDTRWDDTRTLANWYYDHVVSYPVASSRTQAVTAEGTPLVGRAAHDDWTDKTVDVTLADPEQAVSLFSLAGDVEAALDIDRVQGDVKRGDTVGELVLSQQGREVARAELVAAENQSAPQGIDWLMVQLDRLVRTVLGEDATAQNQELIEPVDPQDLDAVGADNNAANDSDAAADAQPAS